MSAISLTLHIMRKFFAAIFLSIFIISALPIREMGKLMGKAQLMEEVQDEDCSEDGGDIGFKVKKDVDSYSAVLPGHSIGTLLVFSNKITTAIHTTDFFPDQFVPRVSTPPPDFI